jgi:phytanoyl-CoA dioxygenase PhyH
VVRANWRRRNRDRYFSPDRIADTAQRELVETLWRDGYVVTRFEELFGERALFEDSAEHARRLYREPPGVYGAADRSKSSYLTKLAAGSFDARHPFVRIALHPAVLNVANGYLRLRSTLRALELWHTRPTPGAPVHTQLWHRDADDVMNVKLFVYFTPVTRSAGPLTYAPRTHPRGDRRVAPEHDAHHRSTDEQMAKVVPRGEWRILEGQPGTVVFADTCGFHRQLKPESEERVKLVGHYVSGRPYVPPALELEGVDADALTEDQYYAVFDHPPP